MIDLEERIRAIEKRNVRVEQDKAWETSPVRISAIALFTYIVIGSFLYFIDVSRPWLNAIVPMAGFIISTLTLPVIKKIWLARHN